MSWLSDRQLIDKIRRNADEKTWRVFNGVYPIDQLPEFVSHYPIFIIINTDTHNLGGNHWKAVFIDEKRRGEVFDSLALSMNEMLVRWMNRFTRSWKCNRKSYQHPFSATCGAFVLYFILTRLNAPSLDSVTQRSTATLYDNETFVRSFFSCLK